VCGIAKQYGSIESGKIANLVMWTGNPLDFNSWVQKVYVEGILAYDREKDARLEKLFPEVEEEPTPPTPLDGEAAAEEGADSEGEGAGEGETVPGDEEKSGDSGEPIQESSEKKDQSDEDPPAKEPDGSSTDQPAGGGR